jgi:hypothetical protein
MVATLILLRKSPFHDILKYFFGELCSSERPSFMTLSASLNAGHSLCRVWLSLNRHFKCEAPNDHLFCNFDLCS